MKKKDHQFDEFFHKYQMAVIRNAYAYVGDYHTAEDICQETFIRFGQNMHRIRPEAVRRWLFRVSKRLAIDYLRKGGSYQVDPGLEEIQEFFPDRKYSDLSSVLEEKEERELRTAALIRLRREKPLWYEIILMSHVEGMDNRAIAEELGVTAALVSKWKERARKWLNAAYEENRKRDS